MFIMQPFQSWLWVLVLMPCLQCDLRPWFGILVYGGFASLGALQISCGGEKGAVFRDTDGGPGYGLEHEWQRGRDNRCQLLLSRAEGRRGPVPQSPKWREGERSHVPAFFRLPALSRGLSWHLITMPEHVL